MIYLEISKRFVVMVLKGTFISKLASKVGFIWQASQNCGLAPKNSAKLEELDHLVTFS